MSVRLPSDLNSYHTGADFERMPPPPVVDIRPRPSDVSTIAGGTAAFATPQQQQQQRPMGGQRIRIFVSLFDPTAEHTSFCHLKSKVCTWNINPTAASSDAALLDLKRMVARKFRAEHLLEEQSACFYLLVKEDAQAHEIDCAEDIQAGDLLGLYLGERYQQPLPPLHDTALDNLTVETPRVTTNPVAQQEEENRPSPMAASVVARAAKKKKKTASPKRTPAAAANSGRQRKRISTELTSLLRDAGSVARTPARVLRQTPARLRVEEEEPVPSPSPPPPKKRKAAAEVAKPPPPKKARTTDKAPAAKKAAPPNANKKKQPKAAPKPKDVAREPHYFADSSSQGEGDGEGEEDKYGVGKKFFVKDECDGIGGELYPAEVLEVLENGERQIGFIGYHEKLSVPISELQEYTQERLDRYNNVVWPRLEQVDRETAAAEDSSPIECFRVGEDYFVEQRGVEYPVTLKRFSKHKPGQVYISFKGYRSERYVFQSQLLRATPRRWETFRTQQEITKESEKRKKSMPRSQWRRIKNEELKKEELKIEEPAVEEKGEDKNENQEQNHLEPATDIDDLPDVQESKRIGQGSYEHQVNRIVYIAMEDESAGEIAEKFQVPIEKLLYDNQRKWRGLKRATNRLKSGTPIVLPITWKGKEVRLTVVEPDNTPQQEPEASNDGNDESESSEIDIGELLEGNGNPSNVKNGDDNASRASSDWTDEDAKISI